MKRFVNTVTVTGADDSINPRDLISIAQEYPFVEFGILLSRKQEGNRRFPSKEWREELNAVLFNLKVSGHLCGSWVRELLVGEVASDLDAVLKGFRAIRWQINTHGIKHKWNDKFIEFAQALEQHYAETIIFQNDEKHDDLINSGLLYNSSALFDLSHGVGVLPSEWPKPLEGVYCGYAGGLSPDNVADQLSKLESVVGNRRIWIDAETHLRSEDDTIFELDKVRAFLANASPWVL